MKRLIALLVLLLTPATAAAEEINVTIRGMVCSFCAQGITKSLTKLLGVSEVDVNLDSKVVRVTTKGDVGPSDDELKKLVTDAGYEVVEIKRGQS